MSNQISIYPKATNVDSGQTIDIDIFLDNIRTGHWQDQILKLRTTKDPNQVDILKKNLPGVTIGGTFSRRQDDAIIEHSNLICIDIDDCDPVDTKSFICADEHTYAAFTSASGNGLAVIFKIDGKKFREAYVGISQYLFDKYQIITDPTSKNVSRLRFVSFDPDIYVNTKAKKFTEIAKKKAEPKPSKTIFVKSDFEAIVREIQQKGVDITDSYDDWFRIGFGIARKFDEAGRDYFHIISANSSKYDPAICDKQYTACLKHPGGSVSIATFYYLAKAAGIQTYSQHTKDAIKYSSSQSRAGAQKEDIIKSLKEHTDIPHDIIDEVVPQVDRDTFIEDISMVETVQNEIKARYQIRKNVISRNIEINSNGKWIQMTDEEFNTVYIDLKKDIEKLSFEMVTRIIVSQYTDKFHPILDFIARHKHIEPAGVIDRLSLTIESDHGLTGENRTYFIKKWLCGMISSIYGKHSSLMLVLSGATQNTGKSEFFRRLLPEELMPYYAESKLDAGKDDEILMTQKLLIMDDEMGGKSKRDEKRLKELLSKQTFSLREPYGRNNVDLIRLAVLCGTSNEDDLLTDPTGNRRLIPIHVATIDHEAYNQIDKIELFMEAYHLWKSGFKWEMTKADIQLLTGNTEHFEAVSMERELIFRYFKKPIGGEGDWYTTSDILVHIDIMTKQKLQAKRVGSILTKAGLLRQNFRRNGERGMGYKLVKLSEYEANLTTDNSEVTTDQNTYFKQFEPNFNESQNISKYYDGSDDPPF